MTETEKQLEKDIADLLIQATKERSHYYTASVLQRMLEYIKENKKAKEDILNKIELWRWDVWETCWGNDQCVDNPTFQKEIDNLKKEISK